MSDDCKVTRFLLRVTSDCSPMDDINDDVWAFYEKPDLFAIEDAVVDILEKDAGGGGDRGQLTEFTILNQDDYPRSSRCVLYPRGCT